MANLVVFLAFEKASYVAGTTIKVERRVINHPEAGRGILKSYLE